MRAVPVLGRFEYQLRFGSLDVMPSLGAGCTLGRVKVRSSSTGTHGVTAFPLLLAGGVAAALPLGPGRARVEVGYWRARISESFIHGNLAGLLFTLGYAVEL